MPTPADFKHNIKLIIAYDGGPYLGWQKTPTGPSIEGTLQQALEDILQEKVSLQAASRTDAGVHADEQVVNFLTRQDLQLGQFCVDVNALLPEEVALLTAEFMPLAFHPTLDVSGKEYHYHICQGRTQLPHHRFYSWHCPWSLDLQAMREAAQYFVGRHDFSSLCNVKKNAVVEDPHREIHRIEIVERPSQRLCIEVQGNNFLYKMVRNIVGTLVFVGRGKIEQKDIPEILEKADRTQAGMTAPAHGLFLHRVVY